MVSPRLEIQRYHFYNIDLSRGAVFLMKVTDWKKTYWQDEKGNRTTILEVLTALQGEPVIKIKLTELAHISSAPIEIEDHRRLTADLSFPIIIQEKNGELLRILDGHHRRQKAIDEKRTHILAKVFRGDLFSESR